MNRPGTVYNTYNKELHIGILKHFMRLEIRINIKLEVLFINPDTRKLLSFVSSLTYL